MTWSAKDFETTAPSNTQSSGWSADDFSNKPKVQQNQPTTVIQPSVTPTVQSKPLSIKQGIKDYTNMRASVKPLPEVKPITINPMPTIVERNISEREKIDYPYGRFDNPTIGQKKPSIGKQPELPIDKVWQGVDKGLNKIGVITPKKQPKLVLVKSQDTLDGTVTYKPMYATGESEKEYELKNQFGGLYATGESKDNIIEVNTPELKAMADSYLKQELERGLAEQQRLQQDFQSQSGFSQFAQKTGSVMRKTATGSDFLSSKPNLTAPSELQASNPVVDFGANVTGTIGAYAIPGAPGQSSLLGASNKIGQGVMKGVVPKAVQQQAEKNVLGSGFKQGLKTVGARTLKGATEGAASMPALTAFESAYQAKSAEETYKKGASDIAMGAAFGGVAANVVPLLFKGLPSGIKAIYNKLKSGNKITQAETDAMTAAAQVKPELLQLPEVKRLMLPEKSSAPIELGPSKLKPKIEAAPKADFYATERNISKNIDDFKKPPVNKPLMIPEKTGAKKVEANIGNEMINRGRKAANLPDYNAKPIDTPFKINKGETKYSNKKTGVKVPPNTQKLSGIIKEQIKSKAEMKSGEYSGAGQKYDFVKAKEPIKVNKSIYDNAKGIKERPFVEVKGKTPEAPNIGKMTPEQFDKHYGIDKDLRGLTPAESTKVQQESINKLLSDAGKRIIKKVGTNDIKKIVDHYVKKYKLPTGINVTKSLKNANKPAQISIIKDATGKIKSVNISVNAASPLENTIGAIRHEIEHYIDEVAGYKSIEKNKINLNPNEPKTARGMYGQYAKGHHKNYGWFEADYLYGALKNDANAPVKSTPTIIAGTDITPTNKIKSSTKTANIKEQTNVNVKAIQEIETAPKAQSSIDGDIKERGFSKNIKNDLNAADNLRRSLDEDPIRYVSLKDKDVLAKAAERYNKGYDNALNEWRRGLTTFDPSDVPLARKLANEAARRGDMKTSRMITADIAEKLTSSGQFSRAAKLLRKSDPAVIVEVLDRQVARLNIEGKKIYGNKWKDLKVSDSDIKEIYKLELIDEVGHERLMNRIHDQLSEDMPVTKLEKFDSWRRMSMLLNPKTHIRNTVGNVFMLAARKTSDTIGAGLEKAFKVKDRTKSFMWSKNKEVVDLVNKDWESVKSDLTQSSRYDLETLMVLNKEKPIFKKGFITKGVEKLSGKQFNKGALEWVNQFSKDALNAEDYIFLKRAYKDALGQYLNANNMKSITEGARVYAKRRAFEATFKQTNLLSNFIAKAKSTKGIGPFVDAAIPFSKTPSNILMRSVEYSPAGLIKALYSKSSGKTAATVIEDLSKGLTGTSILGLGYLLSHFGWAKGKRSSSKNLESLNKVAGEQPYSINTPLGSYTFDWAQPLSIPFSMGVAIHESMQEDNPDAVDTAVNAIASGGDTIFNMSMLKNIKNLLGGYNGPTEAMLGLPMDYIEQAFPTVAGQTARAIDNKQRSTYDPNNIKRFANTIIAKTPFASKNLESKIDIWGNEVKQNNPLQQYFSPGTYLPKSDDPASKELVRLYNKTKETSMLPKTVEGMKYKFTYKNEEIKLTAKEATELQKVMGKYNYEDIAQKVSTSGYKLMSEEQKVKAITKIVNSNKEKAQNELIRKGLIKTQ